MGWNYLSIPKLQRLHRWGLEMDKQFHPALYNGCNHLYVLGLKLNHVGKGAPGPSLWTEIIWFTVDLCDHLLPTCGTVFHVRIVYSSRRYEMDYHGDIIQMVKWPHNFIFLYSFVHKLCRISDIVMGSRCQCNSYKNILIFIHQNAFEK